MRNITKQSITDEEFLKLLGIALWVFNSNCHFIIEMTDKEHHNNSEESWYKLKNLSAGKLKDHKNNVENILGKEIFNIFNKIIEIRNSIVHSFPTGEKVDGNVIPMYMGKNDNKYTIIDKTYLIEFIKLNEKLNGLIYEKRGDKHGK